MPLVPSGAGLGAAKKRKSTARTGNRTPIRRPSSTWPVAIPTELSRTLINKWRPEALEWELGKSGRGGQDATRVAEPTGWKNHFKIFNEMWLCDVWVRPDLYRKESNLHILCEPGLTSDKHSYLHTFNWTNRWTSMKTRERTFSFLQRMPGVSRYFCVEINCKVRGIGPT
jgi:hypothetical protein